MDGSFEEYVNARGRGLLRFAFVLCGDRYLAEDLVQEVLARVHRRWERMAGVEQPDAYVRTAIVRQFLSWRRRFSSDASGNAPRPVAATSIRPTHRPRSRSAVVRRSVPVPGSA